MFKKIFFVLFFVTMNSAIYSIRGLNDHFADQNFTQIPPAFDGQTRLQSYMKKNSKNVVTILAGTIMSGVLQSLYDDVHTLDDIPKHIPSIYAKNRDKLEAIALASIGSYSLICILLDKENMIDAEAGLIEMANVGAQQREKDSKFLKRITQLASLGLLSVMWYTVINIVLS